MRGRGAAAIPYGGGTSVVGGVEAAVGDGYAGAVTIDLGGSTGCWRWTAASRAARIQAGATGPALEDQLRAARPDAAPLPAVVRALDARWLDRDPRRRSFRDALHAHRRPRRVGARGHPGAASTRAGGCPARALNLERFANRQLNRPRLVRDQQHDEDPGRNDAAER